MQTWRVFRIFSMKQVQTVRIPNRKLMAWVIFMLLIDVLIVAIWSLIEPMQRHREHSPTLVPDETDADLILYEHVEDTCSSPNMTAFIGIVLLYKGIFIVFGAALAVLTRNVNISALNDSREIALCIYTVALVSIIVIPMVNLIDNAIVKYAFSSISLWFVTTAVIVLLFGRKMWNVHTGQHVRHTMTTTMNDCSGITNNSNPKKRQMPSAAS